MDMAVEDGGIGKVCGAEERTYMHDQDSHADYLSPTLGDRQNLE